MSTSRIATPAELAEWNPYDGGPAGTGRIAEDDMPPHDLPAERSVLGGLLLDGSRFGEINDLLSPDAFYEPVNRMLFTVMLSNHDKRLAVDDLVLLEREAKNLNLWDVDDPERLNPAYVADLYRNQPHAIHVVEYAKVVAEQHVKRRLLRVGENLVASARNGKAPADLFSEVEAGLEWAKERQPGGSLFSTIDSAALASGDFTMNYLVEGVAVEGQPGVIGGMQKTLKTSVAIDLALSIAFGGHFLGRFKAHERRRVLFMSAESGMSTIQETALRICDQMGRRLDDADVVWCEQVPRLDDVRHLDEIEQLFRGENIQVAVLDPTYLMLGEAADSVSNVFAQGRVLGNLNRACMECGVTPILLHHLKRTGDPHAIPTLADLAFAGFAEFFRWWVLLARRTPYAPGTGQHQLWASIGGSAGHNSLHAVDVDEGVRTATEPRHWRLLIQSPDAVRREDEHRREQAKEGRERDRIAGLRNIALRELFKAGQPLTKRDWRGRCRVNDPTMDRIIAELLDAGSIVAADVVKACRKKPYDGYDVAERERERLAKLAVHEQAERFEEDPDAIHEAGF